MKTLFAIFFALSLASLSWGQAIISPPNAAYGKKARGTFSLTNAGFSPLSISLEVTSGTVKDGRPIFDTLSPGTHVKLSSYSAKIPAKQTHVFAYTATCDVMPCMVVIFSNIAAGHTDSGAALVVRLAHIAYICDKQRGCRDSIINR